MTSDRPGPEYTLRCIMSSKLIHNEQLTKDCKQMKNNKTCFFAKILFTQNENVSGSPFFEVYIGPKILSDLPENLKSLPPYSFGKHLKKCPAILPKLVLIFFICLLLLCNIVLMLLFSLLSSIATMLLPLLLFTPYPVHCIGMLFLSLFFVVFCLFYLMLIRWILLPFLLCVKCLQFKIDLCEE